MAAHHVVIFVTYLLISRVTKGQGIVRRGGQRSAFAYPSIYEILREELDAFPNSAGEPTYAEIMRSRNLSAAIYYVFWLRLLTQVSPHQEQVFSIFVASGLHHFTFIIA